MKILIDGVFFNKEIAGGISRYWFQLFKALLDEETGDSYSIIYEQNQNIFFNELVNIVNSRNTKLFRQPFNKPYRFIVGNQWNYRNYLMGLYSFFLRADIFHSTAFNTCSGTSVKKIITLHDLIYEKYPSLWNSDVREHTIQKHRKALQEADGIIAISESTKNDGLEAYPFLKEKPMEVIYHGVDKAKFKISSELEIEFINKYQIDFPFVLFIGERRGYKNFLNFLRAFSISKLYPSHKIVVIGGQNAWSEEEKACINELSLQNNLTKLSKVSDEELVGAYNAAKALIYPSIYEGFGLPAIEALSCGCRVVATRIPVFSEVIGSNGLFFEENNEVSFVRALNLLESSRVTKEEQDSMIQWSKQFEWNIAAQKTLNFYKKVLLT